MQFRARPDRAHQPGAGVRVGAEQEVPYFVSDGETDQRRYVGARLAREPGHAIRVDRGERPCAGRRVNQ